MDGWYWAFGFGQGVGRNTHHCPVLVIGGGVVSGIGSKKERKDGRKVE